MTSPPVLLRCPSHVAISQPSTRQATDAVSDIIASGLLPAALEFMDAFTVRAVNDAFHVGFPDDAEAVLLIELDGHDADVKQARDQLLKILNSHHATQIREAETEADRQKLWGARKGAVAAYGRILPAFYLHDCVIPRSQLSHVMQQINDIAKQYDIPVGNVFHAGDGNLHPNILFDPEDPALMDRVMQGGEAILKVCLEAGGTLSGEHGIGLEKSEYMPLIFSESDLNKMRLIKGLFDRDGIANPKKIFPIRGGCGEARKSHHIEHPLMAPEELQANPENNPDGGLWI